MLLLRMLIVAMLVLVSVPACPGYADSGPTGLAAMEQYRLLPYLWTGVASGCATSHDRTDGNDDYSSYQYWTGSEQVLMDVQGAGCIYRMWMTSLATGKYRVYFYLDNDTTPRFSAIWDSLYNRATSPFMAPFVGNAALSSGGYYSYLPIPFKQRCKITMDNPGGDWFYYNINYHTYTDPSAVTTWTGSESTSSAAAVWNSTGNPNPSSDTYTIQNSAPLAPGSTVTVLDRQGPGSVNSVSIRIPQIIPNNAASETMLDSVRIRMYWDGETVASVDAPVGEFFGTGLGEHTVKALPLKVDVGTGGWYRCYFPMPYGSRARIELYNGGSVAVNLAEWDVRIGAMPDTADLLAQGKIGYFHAVYNKEFPTKSGKDYLVVQSAGRGCLVGCVLTMRGLSQQFDFLEGDERICVDGSLTPSIYGTGTEDLFNCGWYYKYGEMSAQTHGVPAKIVDGNYRVSTYRMFIPDKISYSSSLRFGLEHAGMNQMQGNYSSVAFYYEVDQAGLVLSDEIDVCDTQSESAHSYSYSGQVLKGWLNYRYEGDDESIVGDEGRFVNGRSEFRASIDPANNGIKLRRRFNYAIANQSAQVYVDGQLVGKWYDSGSAAGRWRDSDFEIPAGFTTGKSSVTIRIESPGWSEFRYRVYSYVSSDSAAPGALRSFKALGFAGENKLVWVNPADPDIKGVVIRCSTSGYPIGPNDGVAVYDSPAFPDAMESCSHSNLASGTTYYYSALVYDAAGHYSTAAKALAVPDGAACGELARLPADSPAALTDKVVTAVYPEGYFYVEDQDRMSGIRVSNSASQVNVGDRVNISGTVTTIRSEDGTASERALSNAIVGGVTPGTLLQPLAMTCRAVGGGPVEPLMPGVRDGYGLNNIGLLVKISGRVTAVLQGTSCFYVDDGSGVSDGTGNTGVLVKYPYSNIPLMKDDITTVVGVVQGSVPQGWNQNRRFVAMRSPDDLYTIRATIGYIMGVVRDQSGKVVPRARVTAVPGVFSTLAADDGSYLLSIGAGAYSVTALKGGYASHTQNLSVVNGGALLANFTLTSLGTEYCTNGKFENGFFNFWGGRIGNGWGSCQNNSAKGASWAEYSFGGVRNMVQKLTLTNGFTEAGITSGAAGLTPGKQFRWSGWVYQEQPGYVVRMAALGTPVASAGIPGSGTVFPTIAGKWCYHEIEGTISSTWALTSYVWVDFQTDPSGAVYFDDFSLVVW